MKPGKLAPTLALVISGLGFGFVLGCALNHNQAIAQPETPSAKRAFRVVLDPGHGGADVGTVYRDGDRMISEKQVTLMIAQQVARHLRLNGYEVILTRESDVEVSLPARTALANRLGADVFLSIHMNSAGAQASPGGLATQGVETYFLNNATDASSRRIARLENSILGGQMNDAGDQMDVALILKDLRLDANLSESKRLACAIQGNLLDRTSRINGFRLQSFRLRQHRNRGVKQALFHVLLGADMPSALVEAGFLSNLRDRTIVLSSSGREGISQGIAKAIEEFQRTKNSPRASALLSRCKVN